MKLTIKNIIVSLVVFIPVVAFAFENDLEPYVGLDGQAKRMPFKKGQGNNLYKKNHPQLNGYIGLKIHENFSVEMGYEQTKKQKKKTIDIGPNGPLLNIINDSTDIETFRSTAQLKGPYIQGVVFTPLEVFSSFQTELLAYFGLGYKKLSADCDFILDDGLPNEYRAQDYKSFKKTKTIARLGIGAQHSFTPHFGVRATLGWENTSRFKNLKSREMPSSVARLSIKNSMQYGLGLFAHF